MRLFLSIKSSSDVRLTNKFRSFHCTAAFESRLSNLSQNNTRTLQGVQKVIGPQTLRQNPGPRTLKHDPGTCILKQDPVSRYPRPLTIW